MPRSGIALRFAYAVLTKTKEELVEIVEQVERDFPAPSGNAEVLNAFKSSRERFETLAAILKSAEARQLSAGSVIELRFVGDTALAADIPDNLSMTRSPRWRRRGFSFST